MADEKPLSGSPPGDRFGLHEAFAATAKLGGEVVDIIVSNQKLNNGIEIGLIVISILTSGSLWLLLAKVFESQMAWTGAILSTVAVVFAAYQKLDFGPKRNKASPKFNAKEFFEAYKPLIGAVVLLRNRGKVLSRMTPLQRQEYEQSFLQ
jgi:hypothetical protein